MLLDLVNTIVMLSAQRAGVTEEQAACCILGTITMLHKTLRAQAEVNALEGESP